MKRSVYILLPLFVAIGCGTTAPAPRESTEVEVGYGRTKREKLTTSVSKLDVDPREVASYSDIYEYLQGRIAGLMITSDKRLVIRGINSINSSTDPLVIVDGTEMEDISVLNPNDIESVSVLKDSSASIYGVRGANGVIIITTKH